MARQGRATVIRNAVTDAERIGGHRRACEHYARCIQEVDDVGLKQRYEAELRWNNQRLVEIESRQYVAERKGRAA